MSGHSALMPRVAVVSGGARGLGLGIVSHLLTSGWSVATFSRTASPELRVLLDQHGSRVYFDEVDLADSAKVSRFVSASNERLGRAEALINNAAIALSGILPLVSDDDIDAVIDTNLKGTIRLTRAVARVMLTGAGGRIINISSIVGNTGYRGLSVYGASKAALHGFTRALARELGPKKITVNAVAPGFLGTHMTDELSERQIKQICRRTPAGRLGTVDDVLGIIDLLISERAAFITGQIFVVDGGLTC